MITLKEWNSFDEGTKKKILGLLEKLRYSVLFQPYNHNFSFSTEGKVLKEVLKRCVKKDGIVVVSVPINPAYSKPKTKVKNGSHQAKKVCSVSPSTPKLKRYICYYEERDKNGELVDDFKEWCDAYSESEARREIENRYRHRNSTKISMIVEEKR